MKATFSLFELLWSCYDFARGWISHKFHKLAFHNFYTGFAHVSWGKSMGMVPPPRVYRVFHFSPPSERHCAHGKVSPLTKRTLKESSLHGVPLPSNVSGRNVLKLTLWEINSDASSSHQSWTNSRIYPLEHRQKELQDTPWSAQIQSWEELVKILGWVGHQLSRTHPKPQLLHENKRLRCSFDSNR